MMILVMRCLRLQKNIDSNKSARNEIDLVMEEHIAAGTVRGASGVARGAADVTAAGVSRLGRCRNEHAREPRA